MSMSIYRVNSAYLRTSSVNNRNNNKSNSAKDVSFGKGSDGIFASVLKTFTRKTPQLQQVTAPVRSETAVSSLSEKIIEKSRYGRRTFPGHASSDGKVSN